jgi:hypothetical protein
VQAPHIYYEEKKMQKEKGDYTKTFSKGSEAISW